MQKKSYDLVVVGGGIFGLWIAKHAVDLGLSVIVAEKDRIGAGASGGLLGALMPYLPTGWKEKKQFQFDALSELPAIIDTLEEETGHSTGYGRIGRVMPIRADHFIKTAADLAVASKDIWHQGEHSFDFAPHQDTRFDDWLSPERAPFGYVLDTLAARVNPREYLAALTAYLNNRATLQNGFTFEHFDDGVATFNKGAESVKAGAIVLAQGYQTFSYLKNTHNIDIGTGIKGQAAHFELKVEADRPVIYDDGVYIVPQDNGTCAVGSTAEKIWTDPDTPDLSVTDFIDKAFLLCPSLKDAPFLGRWAGVRPKCYERESVIGRIADDQPIYVATGGFKISFGLAHRLSEVLVDEIVGRKSRIMLPPVFTTQHHLERAATKPTP
ncbi:MAG: FAD-binding oxidoreductase [Hyphomicrobiales bacterium]